jgi:hypothetical protein
MKDWQSRELSHNIREVTLASQEIIGYMYHNLTTLSGIKGEMEVLSEQVRKINPFNTLFKHVVYGIATSSTYSNHFNNG